MASDESERSGFFKRLTRRAGVRYQPDGQPLPNAPKRSRYSIGVFGPSARLDQDIDELRRRVEVLEGNTGPHPG